MSTNQLNNRNMKNSLSYNNLSVQNKRISNILLNNKKNLYESKRLKLKPIIIKEKNEFKLPSINIVNPLINSYVKNHNTILNDINNNFISSNKKRNVKKFLIDKFQPQNDFDQENFITYKNKLNNYMKKNINNLENDELFFIKNYQYKNDFKNFNNSNDKTEIKNEKDINKFIFQNKKQKIVIKNIKIINRNKELDLKNSNSLDLLTIKDRKKKILEQLEKFDQLNKQEEIFENKLIDIKNIDNKEENIFKNEKKKINKRNEFFNILKNNETFEKRLKKNNTSKIIVNKFLDESTQTYPHDLI